MAQKYLDYDGLLYFWQKIKNLFVTDVTYDSTNKKIQKTKAGTTSDVVTLSTVATSGSYNDLSNKPTIPARVEKSTTTPKMDGTASIGSETKFAAGDHVHPTDTSRAPLASPTFTGTPKAPTASASTDNTQIATTAFVHDVVDALDTGVSDVKVNNVSVVSNGVANIPHAFTNKYGVIKLGDELDDGSLEIITFNSTTDMEQTWSVPYLQQNNEIGAGYLPDATTSTKGAMSASDKTKLNGIASGAEVNQNAFSNVKVGSTTIAADSKTDTLELAAGSNITLTPDATNDKVTIAASHPTYTAFTGKPTANQTPGFGSTFTISQISQNASGQVSGTDRTVKIPNATATTSAAGLMSSADKTKLDNISGDTLDLVAGSNVTIMPNTENGSLTISATDTTYTTGTASALNTGTSTTNQVWGAKIIADYVKATVETAVTGGASFQGTAPTSFAPTNYKAGYYWVVGTAGTYVGQVCEAGDMIFAIADGTSYSASKFDVVQTNLDITSITNAEIDTIVAS